MYYLIFNNGRVYQPACELTESLTIGPREPIRGSSSTPATVGYFFRYHPSSLLRDPVATCPRNGGTEAGGEVRCSRGPRARVASGRSGWSRVGEGGGNPREPEAVLD